MVGVKIYILCYAKQQRLVNRNVLLCNALVYTHKTLQKICEISQQLCLLAFIVFLSTDNKLMKSLSEKLGGL